MSDEQRITKVEKEKDPKRVEAGKKLGALSRAAKEKKARDREQGSTATGAMGYGDQGHHEDGGNYALYFTAAGTLIGLACLYFTYRQDKRASQTQRPERIDRGQANESAKRDQEPPKTNSQNRLRSLDD